jgi:pectinesterase
MSSKLTIPISGLAGALACLVLWSLLESHSKASPETLTIVRDVVYAEYGQRQLKLDIYLPHESERRAALPGVLVVHGGGWETGTKEDVGFVAGRLASNGFVAVSIDYRLSSEAPFPAAVHDVKAAVRWMRAHGARYGIDPNLIGAVGGSAGAHLVAMLATSSGVEALEGDGGNTGVRSDVQAVVAMGGAYDLRVREGVTWEFTQAVTEFMGGPLDARADALNAASPVTHVSGDAAPILLLHSRTDPLAPFAQAVEMEQRYRHSRARAVLRPVDAPSIHAFWADPRYFPETGNLILEFFQRVLQG